jgi:hypothetical protein
MRCENTVKLNQDVQLTLPDGEKINGKITSFMPTVDTAAQTQGVVIKINSDKQIPENLVAKGKCCTHLQTKHGIVAKIGIALTMKPKQNFG